MESVVVIPISIAADGDRIQLADTKLRSRSLKDCGLTELDLEEFVRQNVDLLFPEDDETLLIVGQQVRNTSGGVADLVAIDSGGAIVLIELKRDVPDMTARREPFEFQAIRYAANYALIDSPEALVDLLYAQYIDRHRNDLPASDLNLKSHELALRKLRDFLSSNKADQTFNARQRIVLIASDFDRQTLSACAWLASNDIDIRCLRLQPHDLSGQTLLFVEQVIPPPKLSDYFVSVAEGNGQKAGRLSQDKRRRQALPRMSQILDWGLVSVGDAIYIRGHVDKAATIKDATRVSTAGGDLSFNDWGQSVTGWSAINIYEWTIHEKTQKSLDTLRRDKLIELDRGSDGAVEGDS